jgi:hypothetical protein
MLDPLFDQKLTISPNRSTVDNEIDIGNHNASISSMDIDQNQDEDGEMSQPTSDFDIVIRGFENMHVKRKIIALEVEDPMDSIVSGFGRLDLKRRRDSGCEMEEDSPTKKRVFR